MTRALAAERASLVGQCSYQLSLDLAQGRERFGFDVTVDFRSARPGSSTFIDARVASVGRAELNGEELPGDAFDGNTLRLPRLGSTNHLTVSGTASYDRVGLGMHLSVDPADGEAYVYSDLEPDEAHRVFPCFDQPDIKGRFAISVRAPQHWTVIAVEPGEASAPLPDGSRIWTFPPTIPLSPYMLGIVGGPLHSVHAEHRGIPLGLHCARSLREAMDTDDLFEVTRQGLDYFEEVFGVPYPFSKYDQVFCAEKPDGAMESPACVTITDQYLFRGRPTQSQITVRTNTILHEMAHMWFGDLVTLRWWDDLWLNESFASVMANFAVNRATKYRDAPYTATFEAQRARREDQRSTTHPIVVEVPDVQSARLNFDRITYEKGAAVLQQLAAYLGEDAFFAGVKRHLETHREGNAELKDLIGALNQESARDVPSWSRLWLQTSGVNSLRLERGQPGANRRAAVTIVQSGETRAGAGQPNPLRPHQILLGVYGWSGKALRPLAKVPVTVEGERTEVPLEAGLEAGPLLVVNDGALTYAKVRLDPESEATMRSHLAQIDDEMARAVLWDCAWDMVLDAESPAADFLKLVRQHSPAEDDAVLLQHLWNCARGATRRYGDPELAKARESDLAASVEQLLDASEPGSARQNSWLRCFITLATTEAQLQRCLRLLKGRESPAGFELDLELRWALVRSLAARGVIGEDEIEHTRQLDRSTGGETWAAAARAALPDPDSKRWGWEALFQDPSTNSEAARLLAVSLAGVHRDELIRPYYPRLGPDASSTLERRGAEYTFEMLYWLGLSLPPDPELERALQVELAGAELDSGLRRLLTDILEDTQRALRARQLDRQARPRLA